MSTCPRCGSDTCPGRADVLTCTVHAIDGDGNSLSARAEAAAETYVSWDDDGVTLVCTRPSCQWRDRFNRDHYWQEPITTEYAAGLQPEDVVEFRDAHVNHHWRKEQS